jgi:putative hydrolase of the HAD superfamily
MLKTNPQQIRVIIFDLGNVIVNFDHMSICTKLSKHSAFEPDRIYDIIFNSGLETSFDKGMISPENFYSRVKKEAQLEIDKDSFKEIWTKIFTLNPEIEELISSLKNKYRLLCLSNTNSWHFEYCMQKFHVLKLFDSFILSYEVGKTKPDSTLFEEAIKKAATLPDECVYIDDVPEFVETANKLGMHGIHFKTVRKLKKELSDLNII